MSKIHFKIPYPTIIETIVLYFLLRCRKKRFGIAFRKIKLITGRPVAPEHQYAIIDPDDYRIVSQYPWQLYESKSKNFYAIRYEGRKIVSMHRVIMNAPAGKIVDHKNRDGLDNTKRNLRFATHSQNTCNQKRTKKGSSRFRGVCRHIRLKKWQAHICINWEKIHLGYFENEEDAARAYDQAAKIYHGEFAVLNFPPTESPQLHVGGLKEWLAPTPEVGVRPRLRGLVCKLLFWFRLKVIKSNELV